MEANKMIKAAGAALALLGILHLIAQFFGPSNEEVPEVIQMMKDYEIEMMGTHTLMSFHNGFSIMTGLFMITIGTLQLAHASKIDRTMLRTLMFFTLIAFVVSLQYFHPLAYGLILIGFIGQLIAYRKTAPQ
ncbi:LIC_13387 family protein [Ekhidna sp. To15]|uniref:LIC_13387 family protein n=1 Tax=Ekhidna sp. To15 TaxID=3395267 RepID=UPI003F526518